MINTIIPYAKNANINFTGQNFIQRGNHYLKKNAEPIDRINFSKLSLLDKLKLRVLTPARLKALAKVNCSIALDSKIYLDEMYGKNNYTVISVGRSLASIAETMKDLGANTLMLPMSGLKKGLPEQIPNIRILKQYLNQIGLTKEILEKNPHHRYILFDYMYTGNSLYSALKLLQNNELLGKTNNLSIISINQILDSRLKHENLEMLFSFNRFKEFAPIGKLNILNLENIFSQANSNSAQELQGNISKYLRNLFRFNVIDTITNGNFKSSAQKEIQLLEARFHSNTYVNWMLENFTRKISSLIKHSI